VAISNSKTQKVGKMTSEMEEKLENFIFSSHVSTVVVAPNVKINLEVSICQARKTFVKRNK
jgi:hypothetical protein